MYRIILILIAASFLSTAAFADDLLTIQDHTAHLNRYYPSLSVQADVSQPKHFPKVLKQLNSLEDFLHGDVNLNNGSLNMLSCTLCVCTGCAQQ